MRWYLPWLIGLLPVAVATGQGVVSSTTVVMPNEAFSLEAPNRWIEAPPMLHAGGDLDMAVIPATRRPSGFTLTDPSGRIFGPYAFDDGASVGAATAPFRMARVNEPTFSLLETRTRTVHGPFDATNGAPVTVGPTTLAFTRLPGMLRIQLAHRAAVGTAPSVAAGAWSPALQTALLDLRRGLVGIANNLALETTPVTFESVPTITGPWGFQRTPTVKRSLRDRETARQAADRSATLLIELFMRNHLTLPLGRDPDGRFLLQPLPGVPCVVCAVWRVRDADAITVAPSRLAVWWTTVAAVPLTDAVLLFDEERSSDWRGIFRLPSVGE